ncbi:hypothetical protein A3Q56_01595 [Intoshia linei]|uniref:tetrahydrofolate synthase n=1 Tax=Intoshia linei TaxID=1819745 RepID=A0A177B8P5_9BILA|nr:hypothetical protein A3Q56_01595 [Intoshia linei]
MRSQFKYKRALIVLNCLQSNASYLKNCSNRKKSNIDMITYLRRIQLPISEIKKMKTIHIAGTKGKGSTAIYCQQLLVKLGYRTSLFSSPHLYDVCERIRINGANISKDRFSILVDHLYQLLMKTDSEKMPSYFEFLTLMALYINCTENIDYSILEVGIGGKFDSTNVPTNKQVCGITNLDYDHTEILGGDLKSITNQKLGILRPSVPTVIGYGQSSISLNQIKTVANKLNSQVYFVTKSHIQEMLKKHPNVDSLVKIINFSHAQLICQILTKTNSQFVLENIDIDARFQILRRKNVVFYIDGAHTSLSLNYVQNWFLSNSTSKCKILVFYLTGNRNPSNLLKNLQKIDFDYKFIVAPIGRNHYTHDTANYGTCIGINHIQTKTGPNFIYFNSIHNLMKTINLIKKISKIDVLITGSIKLTGAFLSYI